MPNSLVLDYSIFNSLALNSFPIFLVLLRCTLLATFISFSQRLLVICTYHRLLSPRASFVALFLKYSVAILIQSLQLLFLCYYLLIIQFY